MKRPAAVLLALASLALMAQAMRGMLTADRQLRLGEAPSMALGLGLVVGLLGAGRSRFAGSVLMRFTDLGLAIPGLLLAAAIATILGAILFLRFGFAVGTLGFWGVIGVILLGHLVTIPTALAIATPRMPPARPPKNPKGRGSTDEPSSH